MGELLAREGNLGVWAAKGQAIDWRRGDSAAEVASSDEDGAKSLVGEAEQLKPRK